VQRLVIHNRQLEFVAHEGDVALDGFALDTEFFRELAEQLG
jgi:hypothetical protein